MNVLGKSRRHRLALGGATTVLGLLPLVTSALPLQAAHAAPASTPTCQTKALGFVLNGRAGGTAGAHYLHLRMKNYSSVACTLRGYPGVSAVTHAGKRLGRPADRDPRYRVRTITLQPRDSAATEIRVTNVDNYPPSACKPVVAYGLRVYPPGNTRSVVLKFRQKVCSTWREHYLAVRAVHRP